MNKSLIGSELDLERPNASAFFGTPERVAEPEISPAFLDLFHAAEALRSDGGPLVLQFVGIGRGTNTANVAAAYSRAVTAATGAELLYLDATGNGIWAGPDMMRAFRDGFTPREAALPTGERGVSWGAVGRLLALAGDETHRLMEQIRADYPCCVIDCGVLRSGSSAVPLGRMCDAAVLVTEADKTRASEVGLARAAIERAGGRILGAIHAGGPSRLPRFLAARV
jgi:hypothetical protein